MSKEGEYKELRIELRLSQEQFANLIGVCFMSVSRWELGKAKPTAHCAAMIEAFKLAIKRQPNIGLKIKDSIYENGAIFTLFYILRAAYEDFK